jgi:hypothetical protein
MAGAFIRSATGTTRALRGGAASPRVGQYSRLHQPVKQPSYPAGAPKQAQHENCQGDRGVDRFSYGPTARFSYGPTAHWCKTTNSSPGSSALPA